MKNGLFRVLEDYSIVQSNYSWHQVADYIWIDQLVGAGFSTSDANGFVADEDQMASDFVCRFAFAKTIPTFTLTGSILDGLPRESSQSIPLSSKTTLASHQRFLSVHFPLYRTVTKFMII